MMAGYRFVVFDLISQRWDDGGSGVTPSVWHHWVSMCLPSTISTSKAILYVDAGSDYPSAAPTSLSPVISPFCSLGIVSSYMTQVPPQPMIFASDPTRMQREEDQILAYSWKRYMQTSNTSSIVLFAMAKAVVRGIDSILSVSVSVPFIFWRGYSPP
eukprot:TRINITY_DN4419_c0_g2_i1.p1 TRINITY_DN4419_c0_g2~~TRINITY_DN4419_c0_g2_i1.p1  ORF type:complete len:157 (+),score=18.63 TRINITY_DN4419_c0_g2_i1:229-699(+)